MPQNSSFGRSSVGIPKYAKSSRKTNRLSSDQVDGGVVDRDLGLADEQQQRRDEQAEREPADRPDGPLAERRLAPAGEEHQVDEQQRDDDRSGDADRPHAGDDGHHAK
jgi:hypothetical protein